ncbi:hypothetical protein NKH77_19840 [Streptomyces sp. M19]
MRLSVASGATALVSAGMLLRSGWWLALALVPAAVSVLAYRGAVQAALAYGDAVRAAFDLHRFDLLAALRLPLPGSVAEERALAGTLCAHWRQGCRRPRGTNTPARRAGPAPPGAPG